MSNVVVTGGYGFIGSHLVSALLRRGDSVTVFDLAKDTRDSGIDFDRQANFRFVPGDVTDLTAFERALTPGVDTVIHRILNGRQPLLYDSGDETRCFTYVDDAMAGTLLASDSNAAIGEAFNIGSMTETTVRDVVALAIKIANVDSVSSAEAINSAAHYGAHYGDIPRLIPDSTKAQRELGWRLQVDIEEGIRRTIDWAQANPWYLKEPAGNQP